MRKIGFLIFIVLFLSCSREKKNTGMQPYAFFVAGHTYGKPGTDSIGLHPPFKNEFDSIKSYPNMQFGVLTGDIVQHSSEESWDAIDKELKELGLPVYFVPGNHDIYDNNLFSQRYGDAENNYRTYSYFRFHSELFILLDANIDNWSISGEQLSFLSDVLDKHKGKVKTVFVFVHQLIWWSENSVFNSIVTNWPPYTPDTTNYWGTIEPLFQNYTSPIYLIAGDLGANKPAEPYLYYTDENIHYLAGGMGSGINDNYMIIDIDGQGQIELHLLALQGDRSRFGRIETYMLP